MIYIYNIINYNEILFIKLLMKGLFNKLLTQKLVFCVKIFGRVLFCY